MLVFFFYPLGINNRFIHGKGLIKPKIKMNQFIKQAVQTKFVPVNRGINMNYALNYNKI